MSVERRREKDEKIFFVKVKGETESNFPSSYATALNPLGKRNYLETILKEGFLILLAEDFIKWKVPLVPTWKCH